MNQSFDIAGAGRYCSGSFDFRNRAKVTHYPRAISQLLESIYTIDERPQAGLFKKVWKGARRDFMNAATVKDAWSMRKI